MQSFHADFTSAPDPSKVMEMLALMPEDDREAIMKEVTEKMEHLLGAAGEPPKNALERFRASQQVKLASTPGYHSSYVSFSHSWDTKPGGQTARSLSVMRVAELAVGTTHKGRCLLGTVAEHPCFMVSAAFVLEDFFGDYVEVAVYNVPGEVAMQLYCKGRVLSIAEPYYKIRADGTDGIRVDNPRELQEAEFPDTMASWREVGNQFFKNQKPDSALECYEKGFRQSEATSLLALLHSNRALCAVKAKDWPRALRFASLAAELDPRNVKAKYRQAEALCNLSPVSGQLLVQRGIKCWPELKALQVPDAGATVQEGDPDEWAMLATVLCPQAAGPAAGQETQSLKERLEAAELLKTRASEAFKAGQHDLADSKYSEALQLLAPELHEAALLFSNLAACRLAGEAGAAALRRALVEASCAALLEPGMAKAWVRRARAMERLGLPQAAASLDGLDLPEAKAEAVALRKRPLGSGLLYNLGPRSGLGNQRAQATKSYYRTFSSRQEGDAAHKNSSLDHAQDKPPTRRLEAGLLVETQRLSMHVLSASGG